MGLIKAAEGAIGSTLKDVWKEAIRCEEMTNEVLMIKKTTPTGVISNGSTIVVAPGQCAIIYDNGRVIDATAEEGLYLFDTSTTPSFFAGQFKDTFREMWERFTYNGASSKQQAVFFINMKEIMENRFGTANPIPFQDWSHPLVNEMSQTLMPMRLEIKCFGKYTFRVSDPSLFITKIAGISDIYRKDDLNDQIKSEVIGILQNIINELGNAEHKVPVLELPSQTDEIREILEVRNCDAVIKNRGLSLVGFTIESVTLTDESEEKIDNYEYSTNSYLQKGRMIDSYANAMENAARNQHGVLNGMMGVGIMNMATDGVIKDMANNAFNHKSAETKSEQKTDKWECTNCKQVCDGEFCSKCGTKKPDNIYCKKCGNKLEKDSNFCPKCGTQQANS